jgi:putative transcriptional regulator
LGGGYVTLCCALYFDLHRTGGVGMNSHLKLKNKLKEYRQKAGMTQTQLAQEVGSSKNTISSIETGQFCPTAYLAYLLCLALDCKFEELFYFEEE